MAEINDTIVPVVEDESALDAELNATLESIKTGQELPSEEVKPTETATPVAEPKVEVTSTPPESKVVENAPVLKKAETEADEVYQVRINLMKLIEQKKAATTPEEKQALSKEIQDTRKNLSIVSQRSQITNPLLQKSEAVVKPEEEKDPAFEADRERLKQLGGATIEEMETFLQEKQRAVEVKSTLDSFIEKYAELQDDDTREVFFDFVDSTYNWQNKSGKELRVVLELARESMFRPQQTIQERVLAGANVQEKVNAMQFPGGTVITKPAMSAEVKKSVDELVATGMSEQKALELISD